MYNRAGMLGALEQLAAQKMPANWSWDVLVVDNNSKDHTAGSCARSSRAPEHFGYAHVAKYVRLAPQRRRHVEYRRWTPSRSRTTTSTSP